MLDSQHRKEGSKLKALGPVSSKLSANNVKVCCMQAHTQTKPETELRGNFGRVLSDVLPDYFFGGKVKHV